MSAVRVGFEGGLDLAADGPRVPFLAASLAQVLWTASYRIPASAESSNVHLIGAELGGVTGVRFRASPSFHWVPFVTIAMQHWFVEADEGPYAPGWITVPGPVLSLRGGVGLRCEYEW